MSTGFSDLVCVVCYTTSAGNRVSCDFCLYTHTHLLRNIFANSDVECILRAKTHQLNLTGDIG